MRDAGPPGALRPCWDGLEHSRRTCLIARPGGRPPSTSPGPPLRARTSVRLAAPAHTTKSSWPGGNRHKRGGRTAAAPLNSTTKNKPCPHGACAMLRERASYQASNPFWAGTHQRQRPRCGPSAAPGCSPPRPPPRARRGRPCVQPGSRSQRARPPPAGSAETSTSLCFQGHTGPACPCAAQESSTRQGPRWRGCQTLSGTVRNFI